MLDAGEGNAIYWETCGAGDGKPAVVVHGGPGSGCTPWHRRLFDPAAYRTVLFDQRGAGRSRPRASDPATSMEANTTPHLVADMELLRQRLGVERWLVLGGSWGSTLALAYAAAHPDRVTELVLFGVTTGRRSEDDWLFREGLAPMFPAQWARRREAVPEAFRSDDVVESYRRMLESGDPGRARARGLRVVRVGVGDPGVAAARRPLAALRGRRRSGWGSRGRSPTTSPTTRSSTRTPWPRGSTHRPASPACWSTAASTCRRRSAPHGSSPAAGRNRSWWWSATPGTRSASRSLGRSSRRPTASPTSDADFDTVRT